MIELIEKPTQLNTYNVDDIYSVRIMSLLNAYGCKYPFARFYRQIDDNDLITAIVSYLDNDVTLSYTADADVKELSDFLCTVGYATVLCDELFFLPAQYEGGIVMKSERKIEIAMPNIVIDEYPPLFDLYNFIDYDESNFSAWYVDINHRIRHNAAKAVTLNVNDEIISSAIFSSIYKNNAVLTAVQTKPEFRKMGYGSALVSAMCCDFGGSVYLMREKNKNESFYKRLGFENIGKWRMYK